ncbi:unnamed protein product [Anisakis simplex]|uniref:PX domain-containing protein n=1 Tax=Anisakis simplex TaxID=6269 RepID=A0A0M3J0V1_ANISI|nr:unnamed protein product [Anisakis simplex]
MIIRSFQQANFPSHPATVVDVELKIPGSLQDRTFAIDILYEGSLDARYCEDAERFVEIHRFLLPARKNFYFKSFKRRDISIIDEYESIVGRAIRIICLDCHFRSEKNGGCSLIGRSEDDVYVEQDEIQPNNLPYFPMELPPGAKLLVRDLYQNSDWSRNSANYN